MPEEMPKHYTCKLSWDGTTFKTEWDPPKSVFKVNDTIVFEAVTGDFTLDFFEGSPFKQSGNEVIPVKFGTPTQPLTIVRASHFYNYKAAGATDEIGDFPVTGFPSGHPTRHHTCAVRVANGRITLDRNPLKGLFHVGDTIEFTSPDRDSTLVFKEPPPFDNPQNPLQIPQAGRPVQRTITKAGFPFKCKPGGIPLPPGVDGDDVPTDGGGR